MAKELDSLYWIEELLPKDIVRKRMFGGFAYYRDEKLVLLIFESVGSKEYHGEKFTFEIWNGCMFPVEKDVQPQVLQKFPFLINHPVLPKWLYLPLETENFDALAETVLLQVRRRNENFGTIPKPKKGSSGKSKKSINFTKKSGRNDFEVQKIDTRRPRMFSEEPAENVFAKARKISDFKNLGAEAEKIFTKAGIKTPAQFIKLGWKKTMKQLCKSNPKNNHSMFAYAVIGALQNKFWGQISDADKNEARAFMKKLRDFEKKSSKSRK